MNRKEKKSKGFRIEDFQVLGTEPEARWWLAGLPLNVVARKIRTQLLPNLRYCFRSTIRVCGACCRLSVFMALGEAEEYHICVRCRANKRYEMLAEYLREAFPNLSSLDVLELDFNSPLRSLLRKARTYHRSFYREHVQPGTRTEGGIVCQDITRLTYAAKSLDLIVSSDVLEHVHDPIVAFRETARVLRPGGAHVFTVPPRPLTVQRAQMRDGQVVHLIVPPEYHRDPLDPAGALVFWEFGSDLPKKLATEGLTFRVVAGPQGEAGRIVWEARKC